MVEGGAWAAPQVGLSLDAPVEAYQSV